MRGRSAEPVAAEAAALRASAARVHSSRIPPLNRILSLARSSWVDIGGRHGLAGDTATSSKSMS